MTAHSWLEAHFQLVRPQVVGSLMREFGDLDLVEDAFSAATLAALRKWPDSGLPENPSGWLWIAGRNAGRDILRRSAHQARLVDDLETFQFEDGISDPPEPDEIRDDLLRLLFICCHPDLTIQDQCALALKVVAGLSVSQIANAFVVSESAMEQRITRAKRTIAKQDVEFEPPSPAQRLERLNAVMLMIYLMFNEGWSVPTPNSSEWKRLCEEAIRLARLLLDWFPSVPELLGLLALLLFQFSRRDTRLRGAELVPLDEQDRNAWDRTSISEATILLEKALRHRLPGTYQVQAAIAAVHAEAQRPDDTDVPELERLYSRLVDIDPTPVVRLNHAVVVAQLRGAKDGLALMDPLAEALSEYRWFHAARAGLLMELAEWQDARMSLLTALSMTETAPEKAAIEKKIDECDRSIAAMSEI